MNYRRRTSQHVVPKKKNKLPERWNDYSKIGKIVPGTRILPFKTPLRSEICNRLQPTDRFTPDMLLEEVPNLKLIIDLTLTDRFYDREYFTNKGVFYEKIVCPGGGKVLPSRSIILKFNGIINRFMQNEGRSNPDAIIGVHCTHGLNRTGYLICKYMISHCGMSPSEAIKEFEAARGHKMERELYVEDIRDSTSTYDEPYSYTSHRPTSSHIPTRDRYRNYGQDARGWEQPRDRFHYSRTNSQRSHRSQREHTQSWRDENIQSWRDERTQSSRDERTQSWRGERTQSWRGKQINNKHIRFSSREEF